MEYSHIPSIGTLTAYGVFRHPEHRDRFPLVEYSDIPSIGTTYRLLLTAYRSLLTAHLFPLPYTEYSENFEITFG